MSPSSRELGRHHIARVMQPPQSAEYFRCSQCGNCCRELFVAVTHHDLRRLQDATQMAASSLVSWLAPGSVELTSVAGQFLYTVDGLRLMVLAHDAGACRLLTSDNRCSAHESRPLDCRQFPLHLSEKGKIEFISATALPPARRLRVLNKVECEAEFGDTSLREETSAVELQRSREVREFCELATRWNRQSRWRLRLRHRAPKFEELFDYLGLC